MARTRRGQGAHNDKSMAGPSKPSRGVQKPKARKPPAPKKAASAKRQVPVKRRAAAPPKAAAAKRAAKPAATKPARKKQQLPATAATIESLPNQTLCQIFELLSDEPEFCREVLPLVCSRFRALLAQPSAVWEDVRIDFASKGWDFESGSPLLSADAPDCSRCIMRTAVERWVLPRAAAVRTLVVTNCDSAANHTFGTTGSALDGILASLAPSLRELEISRCSRIFHAASLPSLRQLRSLRVLVLEGIMCPISSADLEPLALLPNLELVRIWVDDDATEFHSAVHGSHLLTEFPAALLKLSQLTALHLRSKGVVSLPPNLTRLKSLKELDFSGCSLPALPRALTSLLGLEGLSLSGNTPMATGALPLWDTLSKMTSLSFLNLSDTSLTGIPKGSKPLRCMKWLDLSGCNIATNTSFLPGAAAEDPLSPILHMPVLEELDLNHCQLSALPRSCCDLTTLRRLNIASNGIVCLPEEFSQLVQLEELSAFNNNFPAIPEMLHKMERLATVDLSGCIYIEVPKSIDYQATEGFRSLRSLDLRKKLGAWKESTVRWLRSLEAALQAGSDGARRSALTWE